jgi:PAS domain S-box-containing protein
LTTSTQRRKGWIIALGAGGLVLLLVFAALNAFKLDFLSPATTEQIVVFTGLSAAGFVLFVGVLVMLVRNLLKLYADQKSQVMGSRLRTRMLWGAVLVSLLPISFMFFFSYGLMNRAAERWFSQPVADIFDGSNRMALELAQYITMNARTEAVSIAAGLPSLAPVKDGAEMANRAAVERVLRQHEITLQGGFVVVFREGKAVAALNLPQHTTGATVKPLLPQVKRTGNDSLDEPVNDEADTSGYVTLDPQDPANRDLLEAAQRGDNPIVTLGGADFALSSAVLAKKGGPVGNVVTGMPLPRGMSTTMNGLRVATANYSSLVRGRRVIRTTYMILLLMMTSLALFAACWLALYLSKQVTKPVEALADAMASIAAGDYGRRVEANATEELEELVLSFNHMAEDLEGSRAQVEASTELLSAANAALEARRGELETMLETIPNGVATLDAEGRIILTNRALTEMLDPGGQRAFLGHFVAEVFPAEVMEPLDRLMKRSHRMGSAAGEMEMSSGSGGTLNLLATVALLEGAAHEHIGYVIVIENATELLRAQKQSAWKEVARRVAHEIKNPLTPISLSAEQIGRHIHRLDEAMPHEGNRHPSIAVIERCSAVITSSVESMRGLVDQFAALAQFPTAQPRPADLNTIVENSLAIFAGRTQGVRIVRRMANDLPLVLADPEAMKRALGNLVDNAVEAMGQSLLKELRVETCLLESGMVELTVSDTGTGLTDEMRERLFLPYFSTKQRGTGLGLAIAAKIIQEHGGTIRAEKNEPAGAKFIVELKVASMAEEKVEEQTAVA